MSVKSQREPTLAFLSSFTRYVDVSTSPTPDESAPVIASTGKQRTVDMSSAASFFAASFERTHAEAQGNPEMVCSGEKCKIKPTKIYKGICSAFRTLDPIRE